MRNVVLIGMPGCGKSTLGVLLAKATGRDFIDTDVLLQVRHGRKLQALLNEHGLDGFLKLEEEAVLSLNVSDTIIATGGSVVYSDAAMQHLRQNGIIVYLAVSYEEIEKRLDDLLTRGVALKPGQTLKELYDERTPLYERACDLRNEPVEGMEHTVARLTDLLNSLREAEQA